MQWCFVFGFFNWREKEKLLIVLEGCFKFYPLELNCLDPVDCCLQLLHPTSTPTHTHHPPKIVCVFVNMSVHDFEEREGGGWLWQHISKHPSVSICGLVWNGLLAEWLSYSNALWTSNSNFFGQSLPNLTVPRGWMRCGIVTFEQDCLTTSLFQSQNALL